MGVSTPGHICEPAASAGKERFAGRVVSATTGVGWKGGAPGGRRCLASMPWDPPGPRASRSPALRVAAEGWGEGVVSPQRRGEEQVGRRAGEEGGACEGTRGEEGGERRMNMSGGSTAAERRVESGGA